MQRLRSPLQSCQRIFYSPVKHASTKVLNQPAHPSRRESKVSPKLYTAGHLIYRRAGESSMVYNPK
ncbi:MAG: hypothetical protein ACXWPG_00860, partial [Ktedonobacteraceae bacterium]